MKSLNIFVKNVCEVTYEQKIPHILAVKFGRKKITNRMNNYFM